MGQWMALGYLLNSGYGYSMLMQTFWHINHSIYERYKDVIGNHIQGLTHQPFTGATLEICGLDGINC